LNAAHLQAINQILQMATEDDWKFQLKKIAAEIEVKK
jgi:hypothetical protein